MCFFHLYSTLFYKGLEASYKEFEPAKTIVLNFRENALKKKTDKFLPFSQDSPVTFFLLIDRILITHLKYASSPLEAYLPEFFIASQQQQRQVEMQNCIKEQTHFCHPCLKFSF